MALVTVSLTDTFDEWRIKTNTLGAGIVYDDSPQLGGNLDLNGKDITGTGNLGTVGAPIVGDAQITGNAVLSGTVTATTFLGDLNGTINTATTAVTQGTSDNSTKIATTAYVDAQVATENTLEEMDDTTISGLANFDVLQYDNGTSSWKNQTFAAAGIPTQGFAVAMAIALG